MIEDNIVPRPANWTIQSHEHYKHITIITMDLQHYSVTTILFSVGISAPTCAHCSGKTALSN